MITSWLHAINQQQTRSKKTTNKLSHLLLRIVLILVCVRSYFVLLMLVVFMRYKSIVVCSPRRASPSSIPVKSIVRLIKMVLFLFLFLANSKKSWGSQIFKSVAYHSFSKISFAFTTQCCQKSFLCHVFLMCRLFTGTIWSYRSISTVTGVKPGETVTSQGSVAVGIIKKMRHNS